MIMSQLNYLYQVGHFTKSVKNNETSIYHATMICATNKYASSNAIYFAKLFDVHLWEKYANIYAKY